MEAIKANEINEIIRAQIENFDARQRAVLHFHAVHL